MRIAAVRPALETKIVPMAPSITLAPAETALWTAAIHTDTGKEEPDIAASMWG